MQPCELQELLPGIQDSLQATRSKYWTLLFFYKNVY